MNPLKRKLLAGQPAYGHLVMEFYTSGTAQILANAGLDFVVYDMEHGSCDISQLSRLAAGARGAGLSVIARPPDLTSAPLGRLLDVGAHGGASRDADFGPGPSASPSLGAGGMDAASPMETR